MNYEKKSKRLSYLLRHCQNPLFVDLQGGWANIDAILQELKLSREELDGIVAENAKRSYAARGLGARG